MQSKKKKIISACLALAFAALLITDGDISREAVKNGIYLCINTVIPSLFPFFTVSAFAVKTGAAAALGKVLSPITGRLFGIKGGCPSALITGLVGGYPLGAKTVSDTYKQGACTKEDAEQALAFCNNSGIGFVAEMAGVCAMGSVSAGMVLYGVHTAAAVLTGIILKPLAGKTDATHPRTKQKPVREGLAESIPASVVSAMRSTLSVCAFVLFFAVVTELINARLPALSENPLAAVLVNGAFEMTAGVTSVSRISLPVAVKGAVTAGMIGWAGLSVHCQTAAVMSGSGIRLHKYFLGKLVSCALSAALAYALFRILPADASVFISGLSPLTMYPDAGFCITLSRATLASGIMCALLTVLVLLFRLKRDI